MKKILFALVAIATVSVVNAANLNWRYVAKSAYSGDTVYILKTLSDSYASVDALLAASVDHDTILKYQPGPTAYYQAGGGTPTHTIVNWDAAENGGAAATIYQVLVHDGQYAVYEASGTTWGGQVAAPTVADGMGTSSAFNAWLNDPNTTWKSFTAVPEPTSGLLLLLGVAGLALRRKQK